MTKQQDSFFNDQISISHDSKNFGKEVLQNLDVLKNNLIIIYQKQSDNRDLIAECLKFYPQLSQIQLHQFSQLEETNKNLNTILTTPIYHSIVTIGSTIFNSQLNHVLKVAKSGTKISSTQEKTIIIIISIIKKLNDTSCPKTTIQTQSNNKALIQYNNEFSLENSDHSTSLPFRSFSDQDDQAKEKSASQPSDRPLVKSSKKIYYLFGSGVILMSLFIIDEKYHNNKMLYSLLSFTTNIPFACKEFFRPVALHAIQAFHETRQR